MKLWRAFSMKKTNNIFPKKLICAAIAATTFSMMMPAFAITLEQFQNSLNNNNNFLPYVDPNAQLNNQIVVPGINNNNSNPGSLSEPIKNNPTKDPTTTTTEEIPGLGTTNDGSTIPTITGGDATELQEPSGNEPRYNIPATNGINYSIKVN